MRTPGDVRVQKRRSRFGGVLVAGLVAFLAGFVPSFYWANPMMSIVTSVAVVIFMTFRSTGLRQGIIRGLILGVMGGGGSFAGMSNRLEYYINARENPATTQPASAQPTQPATAPASTQPATGPASTQPTQPALLGPLSEEEWTQIAEIRSRLPMICLLPNMLVGTVTGAAFGRAAQRRRRRTSATWRITPR